MRESYVGTIFRRFDLCSFANQRDVVFADLNNENPTYDAYEQDIAVAYFFFDSATAFQFKKGVHIFFLNQTELS